jgi:hypothetical protein
MTTTITPKSAVIVIRSFYASPMSGTASFFHAMAPVLVANVLTVAFVYSFVKITQKELAGEEGRGT